MCSCETRNAVRHFVRVRDDGATRQFSFDEPFGSAEPRDFAGRVHSDRMQSTVSIFYERFTDHTPLSGVRERMPMEPSETLVHPRRWHRKDLSSKTLQQQPEQPWTANREVHQQHSVNIYNNLSGKIIIATIRRFFHSIVIQNRELHVCNIRIRDLNDFENAWNLYKVPVRKRSSSIHHCNGQQKRCQ